MTLHRHTEHGSRAKPLFVSFILYDNFFSLSLSHSLTNTVPESKCLDRLCVCVCVSA